MENGKREWNCEISIIDTAIFICGAIVVGEYFGGIIKQKAEILYKRINWSWYTNNNTNLFHNGTYSEKSWGLTTCLSKKGYISCGAEPCDINLSIENDGTVTPCGAIGSIVFTPKESIETVEYYYNNYTKLWGKYGFKDGYNLVSDERWFAKEYIGIDKGIELVMIENYLNGTIWQYFMKNKYVQGGLRVLGFSKNVNKCVEKSMF